ncbi:hypothetical protein [Polaromonas aquatica]|uniref:hypothetical protein n=1 Tax=Polaromonas aquatica TaxID=332657 RepID=UPI003D64AEF9
MLKALVTAALAAAWMASAFAYSDSSDHPRPVPAAKSVLAEKNTRTKLHADTDADTVKVRAVYSPDVRPNSSTSINEPNAGESGWRSYGMLLATLVLMGVIAVRRYKAGRP